MAERHECLRAHTGSSPARGGGVAACAAGVARRATRGAGAGRRAGRRRRRGAPARARPRRLTPLQRRARRRGRARACRSLRRPARGGRWPHVRAWRRRLRADPRGHARAALAPRRGCPVGPRPERGRGGAAVLVRRRRAHRARRGPTAALAHAEDRLADQRNRAPSVAERYGELILEILRAHQPDPPDHALDVAQRAALVAARLGIDPLDRGLVRRTAELHDVGKIAIDPAIVGKAGPLDDAEWGEVRRHTIIGDDLLLAAPPLRSVAPLVRSTHERWDGGGYPDCLVGEDIPMAARIVAACDAYDAMTTDRVYRRAMSPADARAELERCAGTQFDPAAAGALIAELMEPHRRHHPMADAVAAAAQAAVTAGGSLAAFARLQSQLDAASQIASAAELPGALETVADPAAQTRGVHHVVFTPYRHEWDDFIVSTVHGDESLRAALLGCTSSWQDWESM